MKLLPFVALLVVSSLCFTSHRVTALYVSYEDGQSYAQGDRIPVIANKLTSATALASLDYSRLSLCDESVGVVDGDDDLSKWRRAVGALHGDALRTSTLEVETGRDVYCGTLCSVLTEPDRVDAVQREFRYNFFLDGLPAAFIYEDDETRTTRYWGGVPVGTRGGSDLESDSRYAGTLDSEVFLFNHFNLKIAYRKDKQGHYQILRFWVETYSIRHDESDTNTLTSCVAGSTTHTNYDQLFGTPLQPATGIVKYTYDVQWIESDTTSYNDRWDIYLSMDDATPDVIELLGVFLGVFLLVCLVGALYTWVMRDLSYKPVVGQADTFTEEEASEVQMWPLSTQVFFPPVSSPVLLCIACGTGAQLLLSGFSFVFLFRCGVISQSQGANLLTPGAILYVLSSPVGGYVTARLYAIFHGDVVIALVSCLATAISYPLLGTLVLFLVYDVLPDGDETPSYNVMSNSTPLILLWIFLMWPLSVAGGYSGYRHGPVQNFPISTGTSGYHDLNLQDNSESRAAEQEQKRSKFTRCTTRYRILILFLTCGLLPVLSCFINYSYGVAAPILIRSYSLRAYMVASFCLFVFVAAAVSVLMFYRQIRVHNYQWWWSSFASAGSSGVYIFFLSMSWLLLKAESHISGNTMALYTLWFAFLSLGVALMTGFAGVAACIWFNRAMYTTIMRRQ